MIQGLYQSETKEYFRDQEKFWHYLFFDGKNNVSLLSGSYSHLDVMKIILNSNKTQKGRVEQNNSLTIATFSPLVKADTLSSQSTGNKNVQLLLKIGNGLIEVESLNNSNYQELAGTYKFVKST